METATRSGRRRSPAASRTIETIDGVREGPSSEPAVDATEFTSFPDTQLRSGNRSSSRRSAISRWCSRSVAGRLSIKSATGGGAIVDFLNGDVDLVDVLPSDTPVFELDDDPRSVTISIAPTLDSIKSAPVTLSQDDFDLRDDLILRVGFIGVADGDDGAHYGIQDQPQGELGGPHYYRRTVERSIEFLERAYPAREVRAYRHDTPIQGQTSVGDTETDAEEAHVELQDQLPVQESETVNGRGRIEEFDETVAVVPTRQRDGTNTFYTLRLD